MDINNTNKKFLMELDEDIWTKLREKAKERGLSLRSLIKIILFEWLKNEK